MNGGLAAGGVGSYTSSLYTSSILHGEFDDGPDACPKGLRTKKERSPPFSAMLEVAIGSRLLAPPPRRIWDPLTGVVQGSSKLVTLSPPSSRTLESDAKRRTPVRSRQPLCLTAAPPVPAYLCLSPAPESQAERVCSSDGRVTGEEKGGG
jgi:hypothetical protein